MNKKTIRIAGWALGLSMAVAGIGAAVGSSFVYSNEQQMVKAAATVTVTRNDATALSETATAIAEDPNVTIKTSSANSYTAPCRFYAGTTITIATLDGYKLNSVTYTASLTGNYVTYAQNATVVPSVTPTVSNKNVTWTFTTGPSSFTITPSSQTRWNSISVTYEAVSAEPADPSLSVSSDNVTINTAGLAGTTITATASDFGEGEIHYSWTTEDENITLENASTSTVTVKPNTNVAGSATINLKVWGGDVLESNALTKDVDVSIVVPKTVTEALGLSGSNNVYAIGIISEIIEVSTQHGNATYCISDDGTTNDQLKVFRGKYLNNAAFTSSDQIQVGDKVVVYGDITTYNDEIEFAQGNYLISLTSMPRLTLDKTEVTVTVGMENTVIATPSNFAAGAVTYSFDENACATLSAVGNTITVHGDAVGTHTFTVTGLAGGVEQTTTELVVTVVSPYPTVISRSGYASFNDEQTFAEGTGSVTITYSDGSQVEKHLGDDGVKLLISEVEVAANTPTSGYLGSNTAKITFTDEGRTVSTSSYSLSVNPVLDVVSFDGVPDYLIIDSEDPLHSATITVNYKSLKGEAELSIISSNPSKLPISFDEEDHVYDSGSKTGAAEFTITAGSTTGQYSVTVSATCDGRTETKSFSVDVRGEAPTVAEGTYVKATSLSDLETGDYVMAAYVSQSYKSATYSFSSGKYSDSSLTVTNNEVSSIDGDSIKFHLSVSGTGDSRTVTIYDPNAKKYVKYNSSTNLAQDASAYNWTVTKADSNGTFRFASQADNRGLIYGISQSKFGGYQLSAIDGSTYVGVELFKYVAPVASSFDLVSNFVSNYMHMNDVSIGNGNDTNACRGDSGYYLTAKRAWNAMIDAYEGSDDLKEVFKSSFEDAFERYNAWAVAMNDAAPFDGQNTVVTPLQSGKYAPFESVDSSSSLPLIIALVSGGVLLAGGAFLFARRRRDEE